MSQIVENVLSCSVEEFFPKES